MQQKFYKHAARCSKGRGEGMLPNLASSQNYMTQNPNMPDPAGAYAGGVQPIGQLLQNNRVASGDALALSLTHSARRLQRPNTEENAKSRGQRRKLMGNI
jgi:hypothetical protein